MCESCLELTVCVVCTAAMPVVCAERVYLKHVDAALDSIELGDVPGSLEPLTDAVAEDANNPLARTVLGLALLCGGLENEALAEFSAVMEVDPGCGEALYGKALVHLAEGKTAQAQSVLARALD